TRKPTSRAARISARGRAMNRLSVWGDDNVRNGGLSHTVTVISSSSSAEATACHQGSGMYSASPAPTTVFQGRGRANLGNRSRSTSKKRTGDQLPVHRLA